MSAKLLLVSSDEILAKACRVRFAREGFEVEHSNSGHEGLAKARRWIPDIILLDLVLPGMHGLDVLKWLRDVPWLLKVPVVLLIERALAADILNECLLWGADSYLHKESVSLHEIVQHVQTVLQRATADASPAPTPPVATPIPDNPS
jgi:DNA-binding response OmpR family regulator